MSEAKEVVFNCDNCRTQGVAAVNVAIFLDEVSEDFALIVCCPGCRLPQKKYVSREYAARIRDLGALVCSWGPTDETRLDASKEACINAFREQLADSILIQQAMRELNQDHRPDGND